MQVIEKVKVVPEGYNGCLLYTSLGQDKLAETLLKYIKGQLNIIYEGSEQVQYSGSITLPVD